MPDTSHNKGNQSLDGNFDQKGDHLKKVRRKSPGFAALFSAVVPGAGQIYNGKYWKVPVIYAFAGGLGYAISANYQEYSRFKEAYLIRIDTIPSTVDEFYPRYSTAALLSQISSFQETLELYYMSAFLLYVINIIDATVDAHLSTFDISDNLSLSIIPVFPSAVSMPVAGVRMRWTINTN